MCARNVSQGIYSSQTRPRGVVRGQINETSARFETRHALDVAVAQAVAMERLTRCGCVLRRPELRKRLPRRTGPFAATLGDQYNFEDAPAAQKTSDVRLSRRVWQPTQPQDRRTLLLGHRRSHAPMIHAASRVVIVDQETCM